MKIERVSETFVKINDDSIRIEAGPARKRAVATKELLDDAVTATHYKVGLPDAMGKPIVLGEEFDYVDWRADALAWNVYVKDKNGVFQTKGKPHDSYDAAIGAVAELV